LRPARAKALAACTSCFSKNPKLETLPPLAPVVTEFEQERVPAQAMQERQLLDHLDARAVEAVDQHHGACASGGGHPPALEGTPSAAWNVTSSYGRLNEAGVSPAFSLSL